jgi:hypothetical protein
MYKRGVHQTKEKNMGIQDDSFDVNLIATKEGLIKISQMTLLETVKEMNRRTDSLLEICESHQMLIEQLSDKVISLQDALDNLKPCQCCGNNPCLESLDAAKHGDY